MISFLGKPFSGKWNLIVFFVMFCLNVFADIVLSGTVLLGNDLMIAGVVVIWVNLFHWLGWI
jgi:hypothetical protein